MYIAEHLLKKNLIFVGLKLPENATGFNRSSSEQAPGSEFQPRVKSEKVIVVFWDLLGAIKR